MSDNCKPKTGTKEWADENVNFLQSTCGQWKCRNNCWYCYAKGMAIRFHQIVGYDMNHQVVCGDPRIVIPKNLPRNKRVMMPSSHDLFPEHFADIKHILFQLLKRGNSILLVSKPRKDVIQPLLAELIHWQKVFGTQIDTSKVEFRFSITSLDNETSLKFEPGAPLPSERIECLKMVHKAGFSSSVSIEPYLTYEPHFIVATVASYVTGEIWIGAMNYGAPPELKPLYSLGYMKQIFEDCRFNGVLSNEERQKIRWKDSFQRALGIDCHGVKVK